MKIQSKVENPKTPLLCQSPERLDKSSMGKEGRGEGWGSRKTCGSKISCVFERLSPYQ